MAAIPKGPLGRAESAQIAALMAQRFRQRVGLEVWTRVEGSLVTLDRDVNPHAEDTLALFRQIATLSPLLTITPYDIDRFSERAAQAGITHSPTVVIRSAGRAIQTVGMFYGPLFAPLLEVIGFASVGRTPIGDETRAVLAGIDADLQVEAFISPFDPLSPQMLLLLGAMAVESKRVHVRIVEASQYPILVNQRLVTKVPVTWVNGRRLEGFWGEQDFAEQLRRIAAGEEEPVIRDRVLNAEYMSEDAARQLAQSGGGAGGQATTPQSSSGLILPGQS